MSGVLPTASWGWLVWVMLCRRRLGSGWFEPCSGASGAGSFAYESVCRRARAVGAGYAGESDVALTPVCATRTAMGCAGKAGCALTPACATRTAMGYAGKAGCAGDLVCRRSPINSFLKFNLYLIFSGKIFEQKLDITLHKFYNGSERRKPEVEGGRWHERRRRHS